MEISVIIPSYKPREYVWACLESLYGQTLDKSLFEVVFVLNGCNEPWYTELKRWIEIHKDLDFKLIQTDRGGVSNARNIGICNSLGEYLTFIDDDDYISPKYLEELLSSAEPNIVSVSDSCAFIEEDNLVLEDYSPHCYYKKNIGKKNLSLQQVRAIFNGPCMKLIHRSLIKKIRFDTQLQIGEDSVFMFEISKNIKTVKLADPSAIYYRRYRPDSAVMSKRPNIFWIKNGLVCAYKYTKIYFTNPQRYNLQLYCRILFSNLKNVIIHILK